MANSLKEVSKRLKFISDSPVEKQKQLIQRINDRGDAFWQISKRILEDK